MDIEQMAAGRETDALVAEKVMGWPLHIKCFSCCEENPSHAHTGLRVPNYSTEIASAWEVVEKVFFDANRDWIIVPVHRSYVEIRTRLGSGTLVADGVAAPLAICRAALKAVGA